MSRLREWLEIRIGLDELVRSQLTDYRVPKNINIFHTLGVVALAAFIFQAFTRHTCLMFYYIPDSKEAFQSIEFTMNHVPYGWFFRLMHVMGANLMVAPLSREWRRSESKLIEYSGLAGRTYFCIRGLDETEEWFLLEEESPIQRRVDAKDAGENN